jgi:sugar (pentulose or hexulose) kinase
MLGCVLNAGYGAGVYDDIGKAARRTARFRDEILPDPDNTREYETYRNLYKEMLHALKDIYARLPKT